MKKDFFHISIILLSIVVLPTVIFFQVNGQNDPVPQVILDSESHSSSSTTVPTPTRKENNDQKPAIKQTLEQLGITLPDSVCVTYECMEIAVDYLNSCLPYTFLSPFTDEGSRVVTYVAGLRAQGCQVTSYFVDDYYYPDTNTINLKDLFLQCYLATSTSRTNSEHYDNLVINVMQGYKTTCTGSMVDALALPVSPEAQAEIVANDFTAEYAALLKAYSVSTVPDSALLKLIDKYGDDDMKTMSVQDIERVLFQYPAEILTMLIEYKKITELSANYSQRYEIRYDNQLPEGGGVMSLEFERLGRGPWQLKYATVFPESYILERKKMRESAL